MKILFIHQNFPGQFKHLAPALAAQGHKVVSLTLRKDMPQSWKGVTIVQYKLAHANGVNGHPWSTEFESKIIRAHACMKAAEKLKAAGFYPDTILAHPGWGESLFLKEVWPKAKLKLYCEFYYHARGKDVGFDREFQKDNLDESARIMLKNANILLHQDQFHSGISPTKWQSNTFPSRIAGKISVIHDGIDTSQLIPREDAVFIHDGIEPLTREVELVTFLTRSLEPYRGIHIFIRSLEILLKSKPSVKVVIAGSTASSYGKDPIDGSTWVEKFWKDLLPKISKDQAKRVHFLSMLEYSQYIKLLQVSSCHVYLTYPFVLSWSLLEAMSVGCAVVASNTPSVSEVISNEKNGILTNFFDHEALALKIISVLENEQRRKKLGIAARSTIVREFDLNSVCLPKQIRWALR